MGKERLQDARRDDECNVGCFQKRDSLIKVSCGHEELHTKANSSNGREPAHFDFFFPAVVSCVVFKIDDHGVIGVFLKTKGVFLFFLTNADVLRLSCDSLLFEALTKAPLVTHYWLLGSSCQCKGWNARRAHGEVLSGTHRFYKDPSRKKIICFQLLQGHKKIIK